MIYSTEILIPAVITTILVISWVYFAIYIKKIKEVAIERAYQKFEQWKEEAMEKDLDLYKKKIDETLNEKYNSMLESWKFKVERDIRDDAIKRSKSSMMGHISEQFAPYMAFEKYNLSPADARFLGSLIDFVVFNGSSLGTIDSIFFVEVKSGDSMLTGKEKTLKEAVDKGKVKWIKINI